LLPSSAFSPFRKISWQLVLSWHRPKNANFLRNNQAHGNVTRVQSPTLKFAQNSWSQSL
jgi:hypothetical protein